MSYDALTIEGDEVPEIFVHKKHAKYFMRFLNLLPARLASHDSTRGTIAFFTVCGLDVLNSLSLITPQLRDHIINWIYNSLVQPREGDSPCGGFQGTSSIILKTDNEQMLNNARLYQWGHIAMTYTSIAVLVTLGDDLSQLNRKSIVDGVAAVQRADGSFSACITGSENDMRFVYCAAAICNMLDYWGTVDKEKMFQFIMNSIRFDYGFSQHSEAEAHGGTTFCAIAALELSGQLHRIDNYTKERIIRWLIFRQVPNDGFQGRPNKPGDTCYSFWIGAALRILNAFDLIDFKNNRQFVMETQDSIVGGFSKWVANTTDPFHTYFGICGLAFMGEPGLNDVMPSLNISMPAHQRLRHLQTKWRLEENNSNLCHTTKVNGEENESIISPLIKAQ